MKKVMGRADEEVDQAAEEELLMLIAVIIVEHILSNEDLSTKQKNMPGSPQEFPA